MIMVINLKVFFKTDINKEKEPIFISMETFLKECINWGSEMEKVQLYMKITHLMWEIGSMIKLMDMVK